MMGTPIPGRTAFVLKQGQIVRIESQSYGKRYRDKLLSWYMNIIGVIVRGQFHKACWYL